MAEINIKPLSTILDVSIKKWNEVSSCNTVEKVSGIYSYSPGLSVSLFVWLDNSRLKVRLKRESSNVSSSIHCELRLIGQLEQELFTEGKTLTFDVNCTEVPFTEWCMGGVKKMIPKEDPLIIRCKFSVLMGEDSFDPSICAKSTLLTGNKQLVTSTDMQDLSRDFAALLRNRASSDVVLKVGEESFRAHRLILSARSQVFAAMLEHNMEEKINGSVSIDDIEPPVFKILLEYVYTGIVKEIQSEIMYELYAAADKYAILGLKNTCALKMISSLSIENVCSYLDISDRHADVFLKDEVIDFMLKNENIFLNDVWKEFCVVNPRLAVEAYNKFAIAKLTECPIKP